MQIRTIDIEDLLKEYGADELRIVFGNQDKTTKLLVLRVNERITHDWLLHYETIIARPTGHSYVPKVSFLMPDDSLAKIEENQKVIAENA